VVGETVWSEITCPACGSNQAILESKTPTIARNGDPSFTFRCEDWNSDKGCGYRFHLIIWLAKGRAYLKTEAKKEVAA
jgi:hypothetical protein